VPKQGSFICNRELGWQKVARSLASVLSEGLRTNDIVYLRLTGNAPQAALGLASRADGRSAAVDNFIAVALRVADDHNK
jgi:hypothetical protein